MIVDMERVPVEAILETLKVVALIQETDEKRWHAHELTKEDREQNGIEEKALMVCPAHLRKNGEWQLDSKVKIIFAPFCHEYPLPPRTFLRVIITGLSQDIEENKKISAISSKIIRILKRVLLCRSHKS